MEVIKDYKRLERCSKKELIEKIIVRDKHCNDLKDLLATGLEKYKLLEKEDKELKVNYNKALSDVVTLTEENKELKAKIDKIKEMYVSKHVEEDIDKILDNVCINKIIDDVFNK